MLLSAFHAYLRYLDILVCVFSIFAWKKAAFCGNNLENNRVIKKLLERIIGSSKSIIDSPLCTTYNSNTSHAVMYSYT